VTMSAADRNQRIRRYEMGPLVLRAALGAVPDSTLTWRPSPSRWSAHEIVCHCADSEVNAASRLRYLLAEKDALIVGYNQDEWARRFDYHSLPLEPALSSILAVRAHTTSLLRRLSEEDWTREGRHTEMGRYTVLDWLRVYADHLEKHARQIERNVEAWRAQAV
jgi:hypothetical protein